MESNIQKTIVHASNVSLFMVELIRKVANGASDQYIESSLMDAIHHFEQLKMSLNYKEQLMAKRKEIEYMPVHSADVRNPGCPLQIPMHLLNEDQAQYNHGQSLKRLKERGGLTVTEMLAIIQRRKWQSMKWDDAIKMLKDILSKEVDNG